VLLVSGIAIKHVTKQTPDGSNDLHVNQRRTRKESLFNGIAAVAVSVSIAAFLFAEVSLLVALLSCICAFLGPCAAMQQHQLTTGVTNMRYLQTRLRAKVNSFQHDNYRLGRANQLLERRLKRLRKLERELKVVSGKQGQSFSVLMEQLGEYRAIQSEIEESLQAKIIQTMLDEVIRADNDHGFDKEEVDGLLLRLQSMEGVNFSEANFYKVITKAGFGNVEDATSNGGFDLLEVVMEVIKNLLDDRVRADDNIFELQTEHLLPHTYRSERGR
jgi:hypothetical protein